MTLDPQIKTFLEQAKTVDLPPLHHLTPAEARAQVEAGIKKIINNRLSVAAVDDLGIRTERSHIPVRLYRPNARPPLPLLVYFHGGGHVLGSLDTHDATARNLCTRTECLVALIHYRLAPEAKFPAAVEDCYAATQWLSQNAEKIGADPERIAVGGDSAGGNLAAVTALLARENEKPAICFQLLVYPIADYACLSPSYEKYASGYGMLEANTMYWFREHYLATPAEAKDWRASPILAPSFTDLPPALLITAQHDVLYDDGIGYVEKLRNAGVPITHQNYPGMIHGFFGFLDIVDDALHAHQLAAEHLKAAFSTS